MSSSLIIEERNGKKRQVTLSGSLLPLQPSEWAGMLAVSTQWNSGNKTATQHVLGPQTPPSTWQFEWRTVRIIRNVGRFRNDSGALFDIDRADQIRRILESIFESGSLLSVTWTADAGELFRSTSGQTIDARNSVKINRLGRASEWKSKVKTSEDIDFEVTWEWVGSAVNDKKVSGLQGKSLLAASREAQLTSAAAVAFEESSRIKASNPRVARSANTFSLGDLEALARDFDNFVNQFSRFANSISNRVQRLGELIRTVKETPFAIANRALDVANNAVAVANQFSQNVTQAGPEQISLDGRVSTQFRSYSYVQGMQEKAELMSVAYEQLAEQARQRRSGLLSIPGQSRRQDVGRVQDTFDVHVARDGETMISISQRFYGTPDFADELNVYNGLPRHTIIPPRGPIIVPTRTVLETRARNSV